MTGSGCSAIICMMTQIYKGLTLPSSAPAACCEDLGKLMPPRFFKALGDPNRVALLARLDWNGEPCSVTEAAGCCPVDLSVVSRHLATLKEAGILQAEKRGRQVYYSVPFSSLAATLRSIADAIEACCPPAGIDKNLSSEELEHDESQ